MEGEPIRELNESDESFIIKPGDILESSVQRVVGGDEAEQISAEYDFGKKMHRHDSKVFRENGKYYNIDSLEREKTEEELEMTRAILEKVKEFVQEIYIEPLDIKPENIHFLDAGKLKAKNIKHVSSFDVMGQYIMISDMGNNLANAQTIVHEALHFDSFNSVKIGKDKVVRLRRAGLSLRIKEGQELYFTDINEAVTTELEKAFEAEYFDTIPGIQTDWKKRQDFVASFLQQHPDMKDLAEDTACSFFNSKTGRMDGIRYPYLKERDQLDKIIRDIYNGHKDLFEDEDEVFGLFVTATFSGELLDLARIIEKTYGPRSLREAKKKYGEGSFRKLGRLTGGDSINKK